MRKIRKNATWLDAPHFASLLYVYGALFVKFVDLPGADKAEPPVDDLGQPIANTDQLTRIAGRLGQLAAQLGLSPANEKALRQSAIIEAGTPNGSRWRTGSTTKRSCRPRPRPAVRRPLPRTARPPSALLSKVKSRGPTSASLATSLLARFPSCTILLVLCSA